MQHAGPPSVLAAHSNKTGAPLPLRSTAGAYRHPHAATPLRCLHVLWPAAALTHDACRRCKDELREKAGDRQWCGRRMHGRREECGSSITSVPARARAARACAAEKQAAARPHGGATRLKQRTPRACKRTMARGRGSGRDIPSKRDTAATNNARHTYKAHDAQTVQTHPQCRQRRSRRWPPLRREARGAVEGAAVACNERVSGDDRQRAHAGE